MSEKWQEAQRRIARALLTGESAKVAGPWGWSCPHRLLVPSFGPMCAVFCEEKPPEPSKEPRRRHLGRGPMPWEYGPCANPCPARLRLLDVLRRRLGGSDA